jgi:hypothetical protein
MNKIVRKNTWCASVVIKTQGLLSNNETINNIMNLYSNTTYSIVETLSHRVVRTANIRNVTLVASSILYRFIMLFIVSLFDNRPCVFITTDAHHVFFLTILFIMI